MKRSAPLFARLFGIGTLSFVWLLAFPQIADAKGPGSKKHDSGKHTKKQKSDRNDHAHQFYSSRPRSGFTLSPGTGYAGRGYYYGPPDSPYYYERSDVRYYATREAAPREYYSNSGNRASTGASVQRALASRGYYGGQVDGAIGPQSRRAIIRYQEDSGLSPTGTVNSSLLRSLGLD